MEGTLGISDIFAVEIKEDGTYGLPVNLGSKNQYRRKREFPLYQ